MNTSTSTTETDTPSTQESLEQLVRQAKTLVLATIDSKGFPDASYSPFVRDDQGRLYIYVSTLAKHTRNLRSAKKAGIMIIEDEQSAESLYARKRLTLQCAVEAVERDSEPFQAILPQFHEKFGEIMKTLGGMKDFHLFRLVPDEGRLVLGFGQAFAIHGLTVEDHLQGKHRPS